MSIVKWTDRPDELPDIKTPKKDWTLETLKVVAPVAEAEEGDDDEF
jgi:hypothetical protein